MNGTLLDLALVFAQLSLLAFGGANSIVPEMQRQVTELHGWLTPHEFASLFALAQAAPGPNMMVVSLIGWRVAGLAGALTTTLAISIPASVLTLLVSGGWYTFRDKPWRKAVQAGLMPVTAGLLMASAALLVESATLAGATLAGATLDWRAGLLVAVATAVFWFTKWHPLLVLGSAALLGALGVVG